MQIIHPADDTIARIWGKGKPQPAAYRLMTYLIRTETEDGTLLHHVVTGELIHLDRAETEQLSQLPCAYAPWMDELIHHHFLVKTDSDDCRSVESLRSVLRTLESSDAITGYTILPTTSCNARCFYCYEAGIKHETMSDETADKLVEFIAAHRGGKAVNIDWFGGEPLLGHRLIDRISKALSDREIEFDSSMTSNGLLFDEKTVKRAREEWHLKKIQITLDGTEEIYNKTKAYADPGCPSPYRKVLENIGLLQQQGILVNIRMNLGLHNADDLAALVEELAERFVDKTHLSIYPHLLFDDCGFEQFHFAQSEVDTLLAKRNALKELSLKYFSLDVKKLPKLRMNCCMADCSHSVMVLPSGKLGKCENYAGSHFVGNLETGMADKEEIKRFQERVLFPKCSHCSLYPACVMLKLCAEHHCSEEMLQEYMNMDQGIMKRDYASFCQGKDNSSDM